MMKIGSLFSGIGGLELGLERTGGFKAIWQSEIDAYASAVLKRHWPGVPNLGDITKVDWAGVERPNVICGGFPCQDISVAGRGVGITGKRSGLWKEFARAIEATRPEWIVAENVPMLVKRGLGVVLADLRSLGYTPFRPILVEAASVGANHKRERIFIVAHSTGNGCQDASALEERVDAGGKEGGLLEFEGGSSPQDVADADGAGREEQWLSLAAKPEFHAVERSGWWEVEPDVGRVADGVPSRVDRLKCLGNAVVPQVAQVVGEAILALEKNMVKI